MSAAFTINEGGRVPFLFLLLYTTQFLQSSTGIDLKRTAGFGQYTLAHTT